MIGGIIAIARNTYTEAIRDRILYMFLGFAVLLIVSSKFISMMTIGDPTKIMMDVGLFSIQMFGALIAVMMSVLMISREFEQRTIHTILSKPVGRLQYLLGKYFGLLAIIATMVVLMAIALVLIIFLFSFKFDLLLVFGALMTLFEMAVLCAFAVLFATVTKPILGSVLTLSAFVLGHLTGALWLILDRLENAVADVVIPVLYYILPNLEVFNFKTEIVHSLAIPWGVAALAVVYSVLYSAVLLVIAWLQFKGKDIE